MICQRIFVVSFVALGFMSGCATSHKLAIPPGGLKKGLGIVSDPTHRSIAAILAQEAQPQLPTSLAVVKIDASRYGGSHLAAICTEELNRWEQTVSDIEAIEGVTVIPEMLLVQDKYTLEDIRAAAATLDSEMVLMYSQTDSMVSNFNDAAALYWTFVGLWLAPGNVVEHQTIMEALLVDCRTGKVLGLATGDCHLTKTIPAAFAGIQKDKLSKQAPTKAFEDLLGGCRRMFEEFDEAARGVSSQPSQ